MSATLDRNVAIIDGVTSTESMIINPDDFILKAIEPESIPPFTINDIRIGIKMVNASVWVEAAEALARRGLMIAG